MNPKGKTSQQIHDDTVSFFKDAFCADKASFVFPVSDYMVKVAIKIETSDGRGTFFVGMLGKNGNKGTET